VRFPASVGLLSLAFANASVAAQPATPPAFDLAALAADNTLVTFRSDGPRETRSTKISGTDGPLIGIDVRPADGKLYGISEGGTIYTIDASTGSVARVSRLSSAFRGAKASGFDFNPQNDRLRLVAATGQNVRVNVDVGAVGIDGVLTFTSDDLHAGARPTIVAAGYTKNMKGTTSTVLFDIDSAFDILVKQDPPNDGTLTTVGPLKVDCDANTGLDIATDAQGVEYPFLICGVELYVVDTRTGVARSVGKVQSAAPAFIGLAVLATRP
jgi:trimeric autotransporter adhesin